MIKRVLMIILAVMILMGVNGCTKTDEMADIKVRIGEQDIKSITLKNAGTDSPGNKDNSFKFVFEQNASEDIKHIKIGEKVILDFGSNPPDKIIIRDGLLNSNGEYLYTDREIIEVPSTREDNKYSFVVGKHMAAGLSAVYLKGKPVFRGYKITAYRKEKIYEYAFVIKTDAY